MDELLRNAAGLGIGLVAGYLICYTIYLINKENRNE